MGGCSNDLPFPPIMTKSLPILKLFILSILLYLNIPESNAQQNPGISQSQKIYSEKLMNDVVPQLYGNEVFIQQSGSFNTINLQQTGSSPQQNRIELIQHGHFEDIMLQQFGTGHNTTIQQLGIRNSLDINASGNTIETHTGQFGSKNTIELNIRNSNAGYEVIQQGYGHHFIDRGFNKTPYSITQKGLSGMKVSIEGR